MLEYIMVAVITLVGYQVFLKAKYYFNIFMIERSLVSGLSKEDKEYIKKYKKAWKNAQKIIVKNYQSLLPVRHLFIKEGFVFNKQNLTLEKVVNKYNEEKVAKFFEELSNQDYVVIYDKKKAKVSYPSLVSKVEQISEMLKNNNLRMESLAENNPEALEENKEFRENCSNVGLDYYRIGFNISKKKNSKNQSRRVIELSYLDETRTDFIDKKEISLKAGISDQEVVKITSEELETYLKKVCEKMERFQ